MIQLWKAVSVGQCKNPGVLEPEAENLKGIVKENKTKQNSEFENQQKGRT